MCSDNCLLYRGHFLAVLSLVYVCYDIQNENSGKSPAAVDLSDQGASPAPGRTCFFFVPASLSQVALGQAFRLESCCPHSALPSISHT